MFKNLNRNYSCNDLSTLLNNNASNSFRRNQLYGYNYPNLSMELKNSRLIKECSLINEEKLKLENDLNKMDQKFYKIKEQFTNENKNLKNIINEKNYGNKLLQEKNKKLCLLLEDKNLEIKNMINVIKEKDDIIYELKQDNKNKENIIKSLNIEKNQDLKDIYNLKENINMII